MLSVDSFTHQDIPSRFLTSLPHPTATCAQTLLVIWPAPWRLPTMFLMLAVTRHMPSTSTSCATVTSHHSSFTVTPLIVHPTPACLLCTGPHQRTLTACRSSFTTCPPPLHRAPSTKSDITPFIVHTTHHSPDTCPPPLRWAPSTKSDITPFVVHTTRHSPDTCPPPVHWAPSMNSDIMLLINVLQ